MEKNRIKCPYCGYKMPIIYSDKAKCNRCFCKM